MKFCENCGAQLEDQAKFCGVCGSKVEAKPEQPAMQEEKAPSAEPVEEIPVQQVQAELQAEAAQVQPAIAQQTMEQPAMTQPTMEQPAMTQPTLAQTAPPPDASVQAAAGQVAAGQVAAGAVAGMAGAAAAQNNLNTPLQGSYNAGGAGNAPSGSYNAGGAGNAPGGSYNAGGAGNAPSGSYNAGGTGNAPSGSYNAGGAGNAPGGSYNAGGAGNAPSGSYNAGGTGNAPGGSYNAGGAGNAPGGGYNQGGAGNTPAGGTAYVPPSGGGTGYRTPGAPKKPRGSVPIIGIIGAVAAVILVIAAALMLRPKKSSVEGKYYLTRMEEGQEVIDLELLQMIGMDTSYIQLDKGGKGKIVLDEDEAEITWTKDKIKGGDEFEFSYTVDAKTGILTAEDPDMKMQFTRENMLEKIPVATKEETAESIDEGERQSGQKTDKDETLETDRMEETETEEETEEEESQTDKGTDASDVLFIPSYWYGFTTSYSIESLMESGETGSLTDVWAIMDTTSDGRAYFEIFDTPEPDETSSPILSMWIKEDEHELIPDIGQEDAWIYDIYLTEEDAYILRTEYVNGVLDMIYVEPSEDNSGTVHEFYLKLEGADWDKDAERIPPGYDMYH